MLKRQICQLGVQPLFKSHWKCVSFAQTWRQSQWILLTHEHVWSGDKDATFFNLFGQCWNVLPTICLQGLPDAWNLIIETDLGSPISSTYLPCPWRSWSIQSLSKRSSLFLWFLTRATPHLSGWWFGTFYIFPYIGNNHPNRLIFFRGVQTTNQL